MDWYTEDGGGGLTANDPWAFNGTIGQPDAGNLSSNAWTMQGGFWNGLVGNSVVNTTNSPPNITAIQILSDGTVQLSGTGTPNQLYYIQFATNLSPPVLWVNLATNQADSGGSLQYIDLGATNFTARFYRFVTP